MSRDFFFYVTKYTKNYFRDLRHYAQVRLDRLQVLFLQVDYCFQKLVFLAF